MENAMMLVAKKYLKKGWSIIPIGVNKKPTIDWKDYQTRYASEEELQAWFEFNDWQIGIVTGKISGLSIVDVDAKSGGLETIKELNLPITCVVKTGGGGWHYYYKYSPDAPQGANFYKGIDCRNDGGYVVAPPSKHESGNRYVWSFWEDEMADFPVELFKKKKKSDWQKIMSGVSNGSRNESAASLCGKLMKVFKPEEWQVTVWPQLLAWNKTNSPPLLDRELRQVFESISRYAVKDHTPETKAVEELNSVSFLTFSDVLDLADNDLNSVDPKNVISYGYDWLDEQMTGVFPSELTVIGGESGTGKTTFATQIIMKASKEHKCAIYALEDRLEDYGLRALYFEIGRLRKQDKLKNYPWNEFRKNNIKDLLFNDYKEKAKQNLKNENIQFAKVDQLMNIDLLEHLVEEQVKNGVKLFLIDHLHYFDLLKEDISKADYIEKTMVRLKTLLNKTKASMLLIVHYKKLNGQKPTLDSFKDSISIVQNANYVINLWRDRALKKNNPIPKELLSSFGGSEQIETVFYIPKSRNPNGEATITVLFDKSTGDYPVKIKKEFGALYKEEETNQLMNIEF